MTSTVRPAAERKQQNDSFELCRGGPMPYDRVMKAICDDLDAEHAALDAIVADLSEDQWTAQTPAAGWDVKDTIVHLIQADVAARLAAAVPEQFAAAKLAMENGGGGLESVFGSKGNKTGSDVLEWWRIERAIMLDAFRSHDPRDRIPWFGPDMSTRSFATARLMETWSHGRDVADTIGATCPATDRLRHVAHLGVTTRGWSYLVHGIEMPGGDVRIELTAPSGEVWTWGPDDAHDTLVGSAEDFCLVVTQRRHPDNTSLVASGDLAAEWLSIAQAFAGGPTLPATGRGAGNA